MMAEMRLHGAPPHTNATEADAAVPHHIEDQDVLANPESALKAAGMDETIIKVDINDEKGLGMVASPE